MTLWYSFSLKGRRKWLSTYNCTILIIIFEHEKRTLIRWQRLQHSHGERSAFLSQKQCKEHVHQKSNSMRYTAILQTAAKSGLYPTRPCFLLEPRHGTQIGIQLLFKVGRCHVHFTCWAGHVERRSNDTFDPQVCVDMLQGSPNRVVLRDSGGVEGKPQTTGSLVVVQSTSSSSNRMKACDWYSSSIL